MGKHTIAGGIAGLLLTGMVYGQQDAEVAICL